MKTKILLLLGIIVISCSRGDDNLIGVDPFNNYTDNGKSQLSKSSELVILVPDIQLYTTQKEHHKLLEGMVNRILEIKDSSFNIKAVLQVGDITDQNTAMEWEAARSILGGMDNKIDYILATGNHDYGELGITNNRNTKFSEYFQYDMNDSFVSSFGDNYANSYFQFTIQDQPFQLFSLEFGPRDAVVNWADSIAKKNTERSGMLLTHAYLSIDVERYDYGQYSVAQSLTPYAWANRYPDFRNGKVNDGQQLWEKLVYENHFNFVFCGHRTAVGKLISYNKEEQQVLQMIFAEHRMPKAIEGWIQILEFYDDKKSVGIKTYSTLLNVWKTDAIHQYDFMYN